MNRLLPEGFARGPLQGLNIIGEVTEAVHRHLMDSWPYDSPPPRIEEDLSFVPKDREEVVYIYMYKATQNMSLQNTKRWRQVKFKLPTAQNGEPELYYERAPLYLDLHYLIMVHSKFRSDAERLLGWVLMRMHEATHLIYRPRKYTLPDGRQIDSEGAEWDAETESEELIMEKVGVQLVDDLTVGDAVNFLTLHEAPYRPFVTYKARCAMEGALLSAPPTTVTAPRAVPSGTPSSSRPSGRMSTPPPPRPTGRPEIGPTRHRQRPLTEETDNNED